jgi:hypothetical protein
MGRCWVHPHNTIKESKRRVKISLSVFIGVTVNPGAIYIIPSDLQQNFRMGKPVAGINPNPNQQEKRDIDVCEGFFPAQKLFSDCYPNYKSMSWCPRPLSPGLIRVFLFLPELFYGVIRIPAKLSSGRIRITPGQKSQTHFFRRCMRRAC